MIIEENTMSTATERIPVLVSASEKSHIAKMAREAGLSMGEFLRRAAASYSPAETDAALEGMIAQVLKTTKAANRALDDALAHVEQSKQRMATLDAKPSLKVA